MEPSDAPDRPWLPRADSGRDRPSTWIGLWSDMIGMLERILGRPAEVEHLERLLIKPFLRVVYCVVALIAAGAIAYAMGGTKLYLGAVGQVDFRWVAGGSSALVFGSAVIFRQIRRKRQSQRTANVLANAVIDVLATPVTVPPPVRLPKRRKGHPRNRRRRRRRPH